ncbi:TPA: hypothetical protein I7241_14295 [Vibrio vulnificus]|nr:hypothetical protein [Vibrio vulnificus]
MEFGAKLKNKNLHIYTVLAGILFFIIYLFLYRLVLPFGDEPDFVTRYSQLSTFAHGWFSPYRYLLDSLEAISPPGSCQIAASPFSIGADIDFEGCSEPFSMSVYRFITSVFVFSPLLFLSLFLGCVRYSLRAVALVLSMLIPGTIYYSGVLSLEQLSLMFSLLCFLYWKQRLVVILLVAVVSLIDFGNALVVGSFYMMAQFYSMIYEKYGWSPVFFISMLQITILFVVGHGILVYTAELSFLSDKSTAMGDLLNNSDLVDKYPVILRPVITYMSLIFFTPSYLKTPILYLLFGVIIFIGVKRLITYFQSASESDRYDILVAFTSVICVLSFVFMFPNYSNAKYYVFLLPFLLLSFLKVFGILRVFLFLFTSNLIVFMHLIYFSL